MKYDEKIIKNAFSYFFAEGLRPVPDLTVSQWCDLYAMLPPSVSEPGKYRVDRTPYMREILDAMTPENGINEIILMLASQLAKTETLNQYQGYLIHYNPKSYISYQPTAEMSDNYVKTKINPMIETNLVLSEVFATKNSNNLNEKSFKGCVGTYKGANSATSMRMISAPITISDEIDSYPRNLDNEGSATNLIRNRTTSYGQKAKNIWTSTPTEKDFSNIEDLFIQGDQRFYFVPCPHCETKQRLLFPNLKFAKNPKNEFEAQDIYYECEQCHGKITEDYKTWMLANGEWKALNPDAPKNIRSYQLSGLYSPAGWLSWGKICNEFLIAQKDRDALRTFVNTRLGETFYEASEQPSYAKLKALAEPHIQKYEVDERVVRLFAGIDTQDNRFAVLVLGFGKDQEQFVVAYEEILGSPADPKTWTDLKAFVDRPFKHRSGCDIHISACAIDTGGHHTAHVYNFVRQNQAKFYAIKGASDHMGTFMKEGNEVDKDLINGNKFTNPLKLWLINTILAKKTIYGFINNQLLNDRKDGAGVIHFPSHLTDSFYPMLVSERLIRKVVNGNIKEEFALPKGTRNEALDCYVYAYCVAYSIGMVNNYYGSNYEVLLSQITNQTKKAQAPVTTKPQQNGSWLGKNKSGFSIKR